MMNAGSWQILLQSPKLPGANFPAVEKSDRLSLADPGGNATGFTNTISSMGGM
jgi:hypothetical protein